MTGRTGIYEENFYLKPKFPVDKKTIYSVRSLVDGLGISASYGVTATRPVIPDIESVITETISDLEGKRVVYKILVSIGFMTIFITLALFSIFDLYYFSSKGISNIHPFSAMYLLAGSLLIIIVACVALVSFIKKNPNY